MKSKNNRINEFTNSYDLSISDLMSALCCIFLLFLAITVLQLNKQKAEYTAKNELADKYRTMQTSLYAELNDDFLKDIDDWNIEVTPDLTIHFKNTDVLFDGDSFELKDSFKKILQDLFPRLIDIISQEKYRDSILEIRIEGHTARIDSNAEKDYKDGILLSQQRTTNVLLHCLQNTKLNVKKIGDEDAMQWVRERIAAIGYSNSIPVYNEDGTRNNAASRRVEIKIKTKAESVITDIQGLDIN